jgi:hypothetical protein
MAVFLLRIGEPQSGYASKQVVLLVLELCAILKERKVDVGECI